MVSGFFQYCNNLQEKIRISFLFDIHTDVTGHMIWQFFWQLSVTGERNVLHFSFSDDI